VVTIGSQGGFEQEGTGGLQSRHSGVRQSETLLEVADRAEGLLAVPAGLGVKAGGELARGAVTEVAFLHPSVTPHGSVIVKPTPAAFPCHDQSPRVPGPCRTPARQPGEDSAPFLEP
jgi:hypothetical protein